LQGKGYPDLAVRAFLNLVHSNRPHIPIYALVDYDPYGFQIYRTYKYGSRSLDHEDNTTIPGIRWLGIRSDDLMDFDLDGRSPDLSQGSDSQRSLGTSSQSLDALSFSGIVARAIHFPLVRL